jgi:hypothetical protein
LFSNQTKYQGVLVKHHPSVGDLTFEVGFVISAVVYLALYLATRPTSPAQEEYDASGAGRATVAT